MNVFEELNLRNINYCHWKSNEHLDASFSGLTDFDLLVNKIDRVVFELVLKKFGFIKLVNPTWKDYPSVDDWIGLNSDGVMYHFHLHYELITGKKNVKEIILPWKGEFLSEKILIEDFLYIVKPELELIALLTRITIKFSIIKNTVNFLRRKNNPVSEDDIKEILYLNNKINENSMYIYLCKLFDDVEIKEHFDIFHKKLDLISLIKFKYSLRKFYQNNKRYSSFKTDMIYIRNFTYVRLIKILNKLGGDISFKKRINNGEGELIIFIGCDGSGKSTISQKVFESFNWKLKVKKIYLGNTPILNKIKTKRHNKLRSKLKIKHRKNHIKETLIDFRSLLNGLRRYYVLNKALRLKKKGFIIISDRFPQNQQHGFGDGPKISRKGRFNLFNYLMFNIESFLYEKMNSVVPDIVFKLKVDYNTVLKRKPDHESVRLQDKIELVERLKYEKSVVYSLDTTKLSLLDTLIKTKKDIWKNIK